MTKNLIKKFSSIVVVAVVSGLFIALAAVFLHATQSVKAQGFFTLNWKSFTHPALKRVGHGAVVFDNKMWLFSGQTDSGLSNEIWSSLDGRSWTKVGNGPWTPRMGQAAVVFKDKIWLIGGGFFGDGFNQTADDVWSSADGRNWSKASNLPEGRAFPTAVIDPTNGKLVIYGGVHINGDSGSIDYYESNDGIAWTIWRANLGQKGGVWMPPVFGYNGQLFDIDNFEGNGNLPGGLFTNRGIVYAGVPWSIGGYNNASQGYAWRSCDNGTTWRQELPAKLPYWYQVEGHQLLYFQSRMWVLGGSMPFGGAPFAGSIRSEAWYSPPDPGPNQYDRCEANFTITANPPSYSVAAGNTTPDYTVTITPQNNFRGTVSINFSDLRAQNISYNPSSLSIQIVDANPRSTQFKAVTSLNTPPGSYTIGIIGTSGNLVRSTSVALVVNSPPDFSITVTPPSQRVVQGGTSGDYTVKVLPKNGFKGNVRIFFTDLPVSSSAIPTTLTLNIPNRDADTFQIKTDINTPVATYTTTANGDAGSPYPFKKATFQLIVERGYILTVTKTGTGTGTVTSSDGKINCGATCVNGYTPGSVVILTATPNPGSILVSWSGVVGCSGSGTCRVTMNGDMTVSARFDLTGRPDFGIFASPPSQTVTQGGSTTYSVWTQRANGLRDDIGVAISINPDNGQNGPVYSPNSMIFTVSEDGPAKAKTLTLDTFFPATPPGRYTITLTANTCCLVRIATVALVVNSVGGGSPATITKVADPAVAIGTNIDGVKSGRLTYKIVGQITSNNGDEILIEESFPAEISGVSNEKLQLGGQPEQPTNGFTTPPCPAGRYCWRFTPPKGQVDYPFTLTFTINYRPISYGTCDNLVNNVRLLENNQSIASSSKTTQTECYELNKEVYGSSGWVKRLSNVSPGNELQFRLSYKTSGSAAPFPVWAIIDTPQPGKYDANYLADPNSLKVRLNGSNQNITAAYANSQISFSAPGGQQANSDPNRITFYMKVDDNACASPQRADNQALFSNSSSITTVSINLLCQLKVLGDVGAGNNVKISRLAITGPAVIVAGQSINLNPDPADVGAIESLVRQLLNYSTPSIGTNSWLEEFNKAKGRLKLEFATNWSGSMMSGQVELKGLGGNQHGVVKMDVRAGNRWRIGVSSVTFIKNNPAQPGGGTVILLNRPPGSNSIEIGSIDNQTGAPIALIVDDSCPSTGGLSGPKIIFAGSSITIGAKDNPIAIVAPCSIVDFGTTSKVVKLTGLIVAGEIKNANHPNVSGSIKFDQRLIANPPPGLEQLLKSTVGEGAP